MPKVHKEKKKALACYPARIEIDFGLNSVSSKLMSKAHRSKCAHFCHLSKEARVHTNLEFHLCLPHRR